jgi:hypothetical protein
MDNSSERKAIRLAQQVPGLAVAGVRICARISLGTKQHNLALQYLAYRQNIPSIFRNNEDRQKINLRPGVKDAPSPSGDG